MQRLLQFRKNFQRSFASSSQRNLPQGAPNAQLSALAALITNAAAVVEAHYAKTSQPDVPSLDSTAEHPLDAGPADSELRKAIQTIEGACAQLSASVGRPSHVMVNKAMSFLEPACLRVALDFKLADILEEAPDGMHITDIAAKTGIEPKKAGRVLRLLATKHVFREVSENVFANNRLSMQLTSRNPVSSLGHHFTDELYGSAGLLSETLADADWGHSYAVNQTPFNKFSGYPGPIFNYFEGADAKGAERGARFGLGMIGWGAAIDANTVVKEFPWEELGEGASVCDVGAGVGNITLQLAKSYPKLKLKLQDLPERVQQAKDEVWPEKCPEAIAEDRIEFKAIDFLTEAPIPDCDVYFLKNIIHDWPDADCVKILSNVKKAMSPKSRVLVHEYIVQGAYRVPAAVETFQQAPEPLLANYGAGRLRQYNLDIDMMTMLNSQERKLEEFVALGEAAGLKFVKLWDLGEMSLVEYGLPQA